MLGWTVINTGPFTDSTERCDGTIVGTAGTVCSAFNKTLKRKN